MWVPETNKYVTTRNIASNSSAIDWEKEWKLILEDGENEQKQKYNMNKGFATLHT